MTRPFTRRRRPGGGGQVPYLARARLARAAAPEGTVPDMTELGAAATMCEAFVATAGCHPRKVALRTPGGAERITWEQYAGRVRQTLRAL